MRVVLHLSRLYLLGSIRRQVHLATLFLAVILFMLPAYVNAFSLGLNAFERVAKDFGLTLIGYFGIAMAIMLGSSSVPKDLETRALYPVLARPISRGGYLTAHFLSIMAMLAASMLFLGVCFSISLGVMARSFDPDLFLAIYGSYLQAVIVAAVCLAFSVKCSPPLAGTIGAAVYLIGSLSLAFIRFFLVEDRNSAVAAALAKILKAVIPNLTVFSLKDPMVHNLPIPPGYMGAISYYAVVWVVLLLLLGRLAFQRVDL
jgi:ABC-type transport system involved in multi-copper enzyme maturation permease subunit